MSVRPAASRAATGAPAPALGASWRELARALAGIVQRVPERIVLAGLMLLAAAVRLPGIDARGRFDADQGYEMLTLYRLVNDGTLPLLGTKTSVGDFHQGALYYLLLAPVALISDADPGAILLAIALAGVATVGLTWWLARSMAGPVAGLLAGLLLALSPAAIETSTFLWSANPMPFFAALAFAAAWRARSTGRARWWVLALVAAGAVWQLHLLGVLILGPILGLLVVEVRRQRTSGAAGALRRLVVATVVGMASIALLFVPLAIHEVQSGFAETERILAYLAGSGDPADGDLGWRAVLVSMRALSWPVAGLMTEAPWAAFIGFAAVVVGGTCAIVAAAGERRVGVLWLAGSVAWSVVTLTIVAPGLKSVTPGLPNDHYHSFVLPVLAVLLGAGLAAAGRRVPLVAAVVLVALLAVQIGRWPPADSNGGWPQLRESGERVVALSGGAPLALLGVPDFKPTYATEYSLVAAGATLVEREMASYVVVPCDRLFEQLVDRACGGPAEEHAVAQSFAGSAPELVERFPASDRIWLSIYRR